MQLQKYIPEDTILSEYYQLRRTTIKDLSAYIGFLAGFIGAAPFAWSLLGDQLASGAFVRGLWYFFGIVIAAGIFSGIAGLGLGYVGGVLWEQIHRHRRRERLKAKAIAEAHLGSSTIVEPRAQDSETPKLKLVSVDLPDLPDLSGRSITAVKFVADAILLELGVVRLELTGNPLIISGSQRTRFPDAGSRDALCGLIGDRVEIVRASSAERVEIRFMSGCELIIPRNAVAVA